MVTLLASRGLQLLLQLLWHRGAGALGGSDDLKRRDVEADLGLLPGPGPVGSLLTIGPVWFVREELV